MRRLLQGVALAWLTAGLLLYAAAANTPNGRPWGPYAAASFAGAVVFGVCAFLTDDD